MIRPAIITRSLTNPHMKGRSLLEIFIRLGLPADAVSSINCCASSPTRAMPLRTPIVAGVPPLRRTTDSKWDAKVTFSGYGKPAQLFRIFDGTKLHLCLFTVCVDRSLERYHRPLLFDGVSDFLRDLDETVCWMNQTMSLAAGLKYYICSHRKDIRITA